jgi:hypothetical protein
MTAEVIAVSTDDLFSLALKRREQVHSFLRWASQRESRGDSMYLANRQDIKEGHLATTLFPDEHAWWAIVAFSCFGSLESTQAVAEILSDPTKIDQELVMSISRWRLTVGGHRIQPAVRGALEALQSACANAGFFRMVLLEPASFDDRFKRLRASHLPQWGRTTCFDLLLRAGALGIGGMNYEPAMAYLSDSTGPKAGFEMIWGCNLTKKTTPWAEGLLRAWYCNWNSVVQRTGASWTGRPYMPGDLENALCIYQHRSKGLDR